MKVVVGEIWSVTDLRYKRVEFLVTHFARERSEMRVFGERTDNGKEVSYPLASISRGLRGAQLVRHADGHEPYKPRPTVVDEPVPTASDFRKVTAPKGMATASPRMEEAFRMRYDDEKSIKDVAAHFGVSEQSISTWCKKVREKRQDALRVAMDRRTGT